MPQGVPRAGDMTKKACRYCHEPIAINTINKHEARCRDYTPEQRRKLTSSRATYYRMKAKKTGGVPDGTENHTTLGHVFERKTCRYCHEPVSENAIERHEQRCKAQTPQQRTATKQARQWAANRKNGNLEKFRASAVVPVAPRRVGRPPGSVNKKSHHRHPSGFVFSNGNGRRLSATFSVDFKTFRQLLLELAPSLSIDKVEIL